ncbi:Uncharacterized protein dnm_054010 [Desulfonema magnum]|uniref:Uncharacterized protein n=1 Tax=Desulfonema magnum TaxID=45655 RepID=A0A975GPT5_9BACT|nr:Uncharacterized protein dnm_054010 [Desulfonema magnum]
MNGLFPINKALRKFSCISLIRSSHNYGGVEPHMHQAKNAGRGLQPRPKRLFSGVGKYFGRGCKPRPADHGLIKTMSYDLSLMHMG